MVSVQHQIGKAKIYGTTPFYHHSIRNYITVFGNLFNDIHIERRDASNQVIQTLKVPISYGPKEKYIARFLQDPDAGSDTQLGVQMVLPRLAFELKSMSYAAQRHLPSVNRNVALKSGDPNRLQFQNNPVPYDLHFELVAMIRNIEDGLQITEQIVPMFSPDLAIEVKEIPEMGLERDIFVILTSVTSADDYNASKFEDKRTITWTFQCTLEGYIFPATRTWPIIRSTSIGLLDE